MPGRTASRVFASFALDIVGDTSVPKLSLSNQTHIAADSLLAVVVTHAASPPSDPAGTTCAPGYVCSKLAIDAAVRRYPVVLAFIARHVLGGAVEGARLGYRTTRSELGEMVPPHAIDAVLRDSRTEGRRMAATVRAVELVERALRGE